jgi:hypothetical protein
MGPNAARQVTICPVPSKTDWGSRGRGRNGLAVASIVIGLIATLVMVGTSPEGIHSAVAPWWALLLVGAGAGGWELWFCRSRGSSSLRWLALGMAEDGYGGRSKTAKMRNDAGSAVVGSLGIFARSAIGP